MIGKYLFKRTAERFFSREFLHRPKRGFEVPIQPWFAGPCREPLESRLLDEAGPLADWFCRDVVAGIVADARTDKMSAWQAWSLLVLDEWTRGKHAPRDVARHLDVDSISAGLAPAG